MSLSRGRFHFKGGVKEDEDITPMHIGETSPIVIQGPITSACVRQLHK
jgi:hypothetical protein